MQKPKQYDWKDSNLALFGSDTEKQVKKESAESEPAWHGCGQEVGLQIWRIVNFKVTHWPKNEYGQFYSGDSYIILNTYKKDDTSDTLLYDVHFWIGRSSTQDEYGTAAYKTVELDTYLDDRPVQHREVQGHESALFKSYFNKIIIMEGGAESGFRKVKPEEYPTRLFHFKGTKKSMEVKEVPALRKYLDDGDVFILDQGLMLYQWNGRGCNKDERFKGLQFLQQLKSERGGKTKSEIVDQDYMSDYHRFYKALKGEDREDEDIPDQDPTQTPTLLYRLSDASGTLEFTKIKEGPFGKRDLDSDDVFIVDSGNHIFAWLGNGISTEERKNALSYACNYAMGTTHPFSPVTCVMEDSEDKDFEKVFLRKI